MRSPIAREGFSILIGLAVITLLAYLWMPWLALIVGAVLVLSLWFFRDPERATPAADRLVVSPADGKVMYVREVDEPRFLGGKARVISIFLSVFDVHINRSPVEGSVSYYDYVPGKFVAAWDERVQEINERAYIGIEVRGQKVLVAQIAGLIARRIITYVRPGAELRRGQRIGLIKFGSCTQIYLPVDAEVQVKAGDRVKGAETVVGRLAR